MNVQFCHKRKYKTFLSGYTFDGILDAKGGETIALEVIEAWLFDTLTVNDFFEKRVGTARCSDEENYCKKTGREIALGRMKPRRLIVVKIDGNELEKTITLMDGQDNYYVLNKKPQYSKVHFIGFYGKK